MGKLIIFEGSDRSGKTTQAKYLADYLRKCGKSVVQFSFPTKTNQFGQMLRSWLQGAVEYEPMAVNLLFEADRYQEIHNLTHALESFDYVIVDRFWRTGAAYSVYRGTPLLWSLAVSEPYRQIFAPQEIVVNLRRNLDPTVIAGATEGDRYDSAYDLEKVFTEVIDVLQHLSPANKLIVVNTQQEDLFNGVSMSSPTDIHYRIVDLLEENGVVESSECLLNVQNSTEGF